MYQVTRLPNGLRVASATMPHMESVALGLWVGVGGRCESAAQNGISHFIEHLLFKGTRRRNAKQISQTVEGIGGYLNAFTGEEHTCYYAKASHRHFPVLLDVLCDMYRHPQCAAADIAKERTVIKEELLMYRDQPDHYVQELLTQTLWPAQPLGRPLAGSPATLDAMDRATLLRFKQRQYIAANTLVAVAGRLEHDAVLAGVTRHLPLPATGAAPGFAPAQERQRAAQLHYLHKQVEQTHLAIGVRGFSRQDPRRYTLKLLSVILGENMSSRLFQVIRERHGLAYSIQSSCSFFADTGAFLVSAGLDSKRLERAVALILGELRKLARQGPGTTEVRRSKDYAIGQMRLGLESTSNQMMWVGEQLLAYDRVETPDQIEQRLESVSAEQIQQVAATLFRDERLNAAVISPAQAETRLRALLTFA